MEVAFTGRSAQGADRDPQPDPADQRGEPAVGCAARSWRTAEAEDRGRAVDGCQVHGQTPARVGSDVEDLPAQPCGWPWVHGLPRGSDDQLSIAVCVGNSATQAATPDLTERHRASDWGMD